MHNINKHSAVNILPRVQHLGTNVSVQLNKAFFVERSNWSLVCRAFVQNMSYCLVSSFSSESSNVNPQRQHPVRVRVNVDSQCKLNIWVFYSMYARAVDSVQDRGDVREWHVNRKAGELKRGKAKIKKEF